MCDNSQIPPPGWHVDEDTGAWMRDVIHRMGRRCRNWDYCGKGTYQITITLANKGFSPLYKPGGKLFNQCAAGNLLMLAPIAWPYLPGEKKMTRIDACILNRLAQLLSGPGAAEIIYKGVTPELVLQLACEAIMS